VICELPAPFAPFLAFTTISILPRHILEGTDAASLFDNAFNQNPIGTGPYRLAQLDETRAILKANATYHLGPPGIDEVEFDFTRTPPGPPPPSSAVTPMDSSSSLDSTRRGRRTHLPLWHEGLRRQPLGVYRLSTSTTARLPKRSECS
jgi:MarR-like DNA-binding transcriptional regulator SgrR of sgrS sRNA